jgi:glycosyltransferase involved in cell wall biosynthesis
MLWRPGRKIRLLTRQVLQPAFLQLINRAKVTVFLPKKVEGFYLPALEGMALKTIVVCPDCIGNRSFCLPAWNCFRPDYHPLAIRAAAEAAWQLPSAQMNAFLDHGFQTIEKHSLTEERRAFFSILEHVKDLW